MQNSLARGLVEDLPATPEQPERAWRETRETMAERLRDGTTFGYLAYVDGRPAGWVNASLRSDYGLYQLCRSRRTRAVFRSRGLLLCHRTAVPTPRACLGTARSRDRGRFRPRCVVDEGYPHNEAEDSDAGHFRGPRSMYDALGFEPIDVRERDTVMRLSAVSAADKP